MSGEITVDESIEIHAQDGQVLTGTLYTPTEKPVGAVQIHTGMGIRRQFYRSFANYLAGRGYAVLTFDYRGTGGSRPRSLRGYDARLRDWGDKDMPAAFDWLGQRFPDVPKFVVAHSLGGQLIGLMPNYASIDGIVLLFSATSHVASLPFPFLLYPVVVLYMFFPATIPLFGYAPARYVTPGQDLPSGIAWEWLRWTLRHGYLSHFLSRDTERYHFPRITAPLQAFVMDDDPMARLTHSRELVADYYPNTQSAFTVLRAADAPKRKVGHFDYFRRKIGEGYWPQVADWLDQQVASRAPHAHPNVGPAVTASPTHAASR